MGIQDRNILVDQIVNDSVGTRERRRRGARRRKRVRHDVFTDVPFKTWHTSGDLTTHFDKLATYFTRYENMNDTIGDNGGEHHVDHVLITSSCGSRKSFTYSNADGYLKGGSNFGPWEMVGWETIHSLTPIVTASSLGDASSTALKRATDIFPTVLLFPNFLWELRDWRNLPEIIKDLRKKWDTFNSYQRGYKKSWGRYLMYLKRPGIKAELLQWLTGKRLANALLAKQFGLDPFLRDCKSLFSLLSTMEKRIAFLKKTMGKRYKFGYREELPIPTGLMETSYNLGTTRLECEYYRAYVNYTFEISHNVKDLDSLRSRIGYAMAALGIDSPAAIIWEAVPYSFLVDWFAGVQDILEQLKVNPFLTGEITVHKVSTSVTQRSSMAHYITVYGLNKTLLDRYHMRRYWRLPGLPTKSWVDLKAELTDNQLLLVAALLRQRVK